MLLVSLGWIFFGNSFTVGHKPPSGSSTNWGVFTVTCYVMSARQLNIKIWTPVQERFDVRQFVCGFQLFHTYVLVLRWPVLSIPTNQGVYSVACIMLCNEKHNGQSKTISARLQQHKLPIMCIQITAALFKDQHQTGRNFYLFIECSSFSSKMI